MTAVYALMFLEFVGFVVLWIALTNLARRINQPRAERPLSETISEASAKARRGPEDTEALDVVQNYMGHHRRNRARLREESEKEVVELAKQGKWPPREVL